MKYVTLIVTDTRPPPLGIHSWKNIATQRKYFDWLSEQLEIKVKIIDIQYI